MKGGSPSQYVSRKKMGDTEKKNGGGGGKEWGENKGKEAPC
jgi:hypothetical protein